VNFTSPFPHLPAGVRRTRIAYRGEAERHCAPSVQREWLASGRPFEFHHLAPQNADQVQVHLRPGSAGSPCTSAATGTPVVIGCTLHDLRSGYAQPLDQPFDSVSFTFPAETLRLWAERQGIRGFGGLRYEPGQVIADDVIANFALALLPSLAEPAAAVRLFVDYLLNAAGIHLVRTFGSAASRDIRGGLAPWQERRAKAMMAQATDFHLSLGQLASECRLSVSHFVTAFRRTTGETPYQWHLRRRIDRAMVLLTDDLQPLVTIAVECGFADQSHFTRAFSKIVGMSPGAWRKWAKD